MSGDHGAKGTRVLIMLGNGHNDLAKDVIIEILLRLSVTSICRFKCVCRYWYDVIESPEFREQHYALQNNSTFVVEDYLGVVIKVFAEKNLRLVENVKMPVWSRCDTHPCRGIFLLRSCSDLFGLLNPTTRAFKLLPRMPDVVVHARYVRNCAYGLGWDPSTNDYKVVFFLYHSLVGAIYSSNSDSWKLLDSPPPKLISGCIMNDKDWNIHINGFCYWLTSYAIHPSLVSFDMAQEKFAMVTLPPNVMDGKETILSTYYNSPALLYWGRHDRVLEIWVLQQQQHFWTKAFSFRQMDYETSAIGIWNNTHVLLLREYANKLSKEIFMYDMNNDHHEEKVTIDCLTTFPNYRKSLFSVAKRGGTASDIRHFKYGYYSY